MKKLTIKRIAKFTSLILLFFLLTPAFYPISVSAYTTNMSASVVIGQSNFTSNTANQGGTVGANSMSNPVGVAVYNGKLLISDRNNNRVLIFNQVPTSNNVSADIVIGQQNFSGVSANQGGSIAANTLNSPRGIYIVDGKLFIADRSNNRVLIYNQIPTVNNASADVVIGQGAFNTATGGNAANQYLNPTSIAYDGSSGKLIVIDDNNDRTLIYNTIPTTNGAAADVVIGQPDFSTITSGCTASKTADVMDVRVINSKLLISDPSNNRVLIFNQLPTSNGASADIVIGQQDFTHCTSNQGAIGANTFASPTSIGFDGVRLAIFDAGNARILLFNGIPTQNNASAYMVLGQPNFTSNGVNQGGSTAANTMGRPNNQGDLVFYNNKLFFADRDNARVLIYNNIEDIPSLSLSNTITDGTNGKLRFNGTTSTTSSSSYIPTNVDYSVNRGSYQGATPKDGAWDSIREDYYFDFLPTDNDYKGDGYTVKVRTKNSNLDQSDTAFFFQPFSLNSPANNTFSPTGLPTFSYNVNKDLFSELKDNLSKFQVQTRRSGKGWRTYIDDIPVNYEAVKENPDNLNNTKGTDGKGNGTYETKKLTVIYSSDNSTISVTPKPVDSDGNTTSNLFPENSQRLASGVYEWKIVAVDKVGHTQDTETRNLKVGGTSTGSSSGVYFPISLLSLSTSSINNISTNYPQGIKNAYTAYTTTPTLKGIAFAGSTITLNLTDTSCVTVLNPNDPACMKTVTTITGGDSRFVMTVPAKNLQLGKKYTTSLTVTKDGQFNALPDFTLSVVAYTAPTDAPKSTPKKTTTK